jgi:hypothetical protein
MLGASQDHLLPPPCLPFRKKGASGNESETSELSAHLTYRSKTRKILEYRKLSTSTNEYSVLNAQVEYVHKHQPVDPNELINDNL